MRYASGRLYYGWFVLAAVSGMNFANGATAIGVLTVFILPLTADFGWTRTQVSSTGVGLHLVPYLQQQGIAQTAAVQTVSLGFLASGLSNLLWGISADRLPIRPLLVGTYALKTVSLAVLLGANTVPQAYLFTVLQGIATGGLGTLTAILLAEYYGRLHLGAIYGLLRALQVAGFALGPLVSGVTFDITQSYRGAFVVFLGLSLVGTVLIGLARPPRHPRTAP